MKINIKAFALAFSVLMILLLLLISTWGRLSPGFGQEFLEAFYSVHPHPYRATAANLQVWEHLFGLTFDFFYTLVDSLVFAVCFGLLYNRILALSSGKQPDK